MVEERLLLVLGTDFIFCKVNFGGEPQLFGSPNFTEHYHVADIENPYLK